MDKHFRSVFTMTAPHIIDVLCAESQQILPSQGFKDGKQAPLHDMVPFISDEEMQQEMICK